MNARQRKKPGDFVAIPLEDKMFGFGRVLPMPLMGFYDVRVREIPDISSLSSARVLFSVWVMKSTSVWPTIGNAQLEEELLRKPLFFKQDPLSGRLTIYSGGFEKGVPATLDQCKGLERAAVWDASHIVDRLNDYFAGRPCKWIREIEP
jgi:hypothetical protein